MFRAMRRFKQQVSDEECIKILKKEMRGILSVLGDEDYPYGIPLNFYYDPEENKLYFHSAKSGHKLDAIRKHEKVSFCVYDQGYQEEGDWALYITSVIAFGKIKVIEDLADKEDKLRKLGLKYFPPTQDVEVDVAKGMKHCEMLEMTIEHMTGKLVHES